MVLNDTGYDYGHTSHVHYIELWNENDEMNEWKESLEMTQERGKLQSAC